MFNSGNIVGADYMGCQYDGRYHYDPQTQTLNGVVTLTVPAGTPLVTGEGPSVVPYEKRFEISLPQDLGAGRSIRIGTGGPFGGPVDVLFKKIREIP
jgi:hypothetical protein